MKKLLLAIPVFISLIVTSAYATESINTNFIDAKGKNIGSATLKEVNDGTLITIDLLLPKGEYAIHIHDTAKCDAPDFKTAGKHFNPKNNQHGFTSKEGFHAGDLPNLYVESTNHIKTEIFSGQLHLSKRHQIDHGVAIIIHEKADDYITDPSGNAGNRIACAIVKK